MQPLSEFMPAALAAIIRKAPLSPGKIQLAWKVAVGLALERVTTVRLAPDGVLEVTSHDPHWRREIRRLTPLILRHLEDQLGPGTVGNLKVVGEPAVSYKRRPQSGSRRPDVHEAGSPRGPRSKTRRHSARKAR